MFPDKTFNNRFDIKKVLTSQPDMLDDSIFNKDVYFRITSNNIGSWDDRWMFIGDNWDDQFVIKFFMPILVKGEIDVLLDNSLTPTYLPSESFHNSFSLSDVIPDWGFPDFGKYFTYLMIFFVIIIVLVFLPNVFLLFNTLIGILVKTIKPKK